MSTQAKIGYGSKFAMIDYAVVPNDYVNIGEVTNITPPNESSDVIDATSNDSEDAMREFIIGLTDPGEASFEMNLVPGGASEALIIANRARRAACGCRITFPGLQKWTFLAIVTGYQPANPFDDKMTATVTLKVTGKVTRV